MSNWKKRWKKMVASVLAVTLLVTSIQLTNFRTQASETTLVRPVYGKQYQDLFANVKEEHIVMTWGQYGYQGKAWNAESDASTGLLSSVSYNTTEGIQGTDYAGVDAQFGYDFKGEITDFAKNVAKKSLSEMLGTTWHVLQKYSSGLSDLQPEDTFVYETDIQIESLDSNKEGIYFNFRVPALQGEGNYWRAMRTGLRLTADGLYLYMMGTTELARYRYDFTKSYQKKLHFTILSSADKVSVWMGDTLIFHEVTFQLPENMVKEVNGIACVDGDLELPLKDATEMVPNIGMYVQGASKFTISGQHLYLYDGVGGAWDIEEKNYFESDSLMVDGEIVKGKNRIQASVTDGAVSVGQDLSSVLKKEDTVITELEYTPTNIHALDSNNIWANIVQLDVGFRTDGTKGGLLKMRLRVVYGQTFLHFVDEHMETASLAATTNVLEGQKVRLTIVHDAEKVSVYMNGLALYQDFPYNQIRNNTKDPVNSVDFENLKPTFQIYMGYADWNLEYISIRKAGDNVTTDNLMSGEMCPEAESTKTEMWGNNLYTDRNQETEKIWLFGKNNESAPIEKNDSYIWSSLVNVEELSEQSALNMVLGTYDGVNARISLKKSDESDVMLHLMLGEKVVQTRNLSEQIGYHMGDTVRLTADVSPFGFDILTDGLVIAHFDAPEGAGADYRNMSYEAQDVAARLSQITIYKNEGNSAIYKEKVQVYAEELSYLLKGMYHEKQEAYQTLQNRMQQACDTYDGKSYDALKEFLDYGHLCETIRKEGKAVQNKVLDGSASVESDMTFVTESGGDGWKYGGITFFQNGCEMKRGETWLFEAKATCKETLAGTTRIGFGVSGYRGDDFSDVMLQGANEYYYGSDWSYVGNATESFNTGAVWNIQYVVKPFESVRTLITKEDGTTVADYTATWNQLSFASQKTEDSIFKPYLMFVNVKVELQNISISQSVAEKELENLKTTIQNYQGKDVSLYTKQSILAYENALEDAKRVLEECEAVSKGNLPYSKEEIAQAGTDLVSATEQLTGKTLEFVVGGEKSHTTESICVASADEPLPTNVVIDDSKYLIRWTLNGKEVTSYDASKKVTDYVAEFADLKMLDVKFQQGTQKSSKKRDIRYITSVDGLKYDELGFVFSTKNDSPTVGGDSCVQRSTTKVYRTVIADGEKMTVSDAGYDAYSNYMYTFIIRNTPIDRTVYARAYVKIGDQYVYGRVREVTAENDSTITELKKAAITDVFHDQGSVYMVPLEPKAGETVTLRLRTAHHNVTEAALQYYTTTNTKTQTVSMTLEKTEPYYDTWKCELTVPEQNVYYWFRVKNNGWSTTKYYALSGLKSDSISSGSTGVDFFRIIPGQTTPDWAKGALWYSLMPDAFYNGNTTNDKQISGDNGYTTWDKLHKDLSDRYGGDLQGVEDKLDYISEYSVDAIYMNPIAKAYQNAGYGTVRYDEIESAFGNLENLTSLSEKVHDRGMKLTSDTVLYFTNTTSYYFNTDGRWPVLGAYKNPDSIWSGLYKFTDATNENYVNTEWGGPSLNLASSASANLLYATQNAALTKYATLLDGYRFDCGGYLWGETADGTSVERAKLIADIRAKLHEVNEEFYLLSEYDGDNMDNNSWDSQWNLPYNTALAGYAKGTISAQDLVKKMYANEMKAPRTTALCFQNMLCTHDEERIEQSLDYMYQPAVLIQMTYLGSPVIYYGEEVGLHRDDEGNIGYSRTNAANESYTASFYSMDWDESNWNQERRTFYKELGELRKQYECVKTGAVKMLSEGTDANQSIVFGRWNETAAVVTVASQSTSSYTIEIDVKSLDVKDGTTMTDWFTGEVYVVKSGKITANITPGGTVIVTGSRKADTDSFENQLAYDGFSAETMVSENGTFFIRNGLESEDMYYGVTIDNGSASVIARLSRGGAVKTLAKDLAVSETVKLVREQNNSFAVYLDGTMIAESVVFIGMDQKVHYGFESDTKHTPDITVSNLSVATWDDYQGVVPSAMFDGMDKNDVITMRDYLTVTNRDNKQKTLLGHSPEHDWTFKTKIVVQDLQSGGYSGVISRQDSDHYVVAGRKTTSNGSVLFIGQATDGKLEILSSVSDAGGEVIVQLQRIGAYYSAVYSYDDGQTWQNIGKLFANYSLEQVGIVAAGIGKATFDWVSFGDSIHDGSSVHTPYTPNQADLTYTNDTTKKEAKYEYVGGTWSMADEGFAQTELADSYAQLQVTNKQYEGLYAEATIRIDNAKNGGYAGFAFGMPEQDKQVESGFALCLYPNGQLVCRQGTTTLATAQITGTSNGSVRLVLRAFDGRILVYAGQEEHLVISLEQTEYQRGYTSMFTKGVTASFCNFHHGSTNATWDWISGSGSGGGNSICTLDASYNVGSTRREVPSIVTYAGSGFTDFVLSGEVQITQTEGVQSAKAGFLLGASEGVSETEEGVYIYIDGDGNLKLSVAGTVKQSYSLADTSLAVKLMVVKQQNHYWVYVNGSESPVITYEAANGDGGALSVCTRNCHGTFTGISIENLQPSQSKAESSIVKNWIRLGGISADFQDDFSSAESLNQYLLYNTTEADFIIRDGKLVCKDATDWHAGATVVNKKYKDCEIEFDLTVDGTAGWVGIGVRKDRANGNHNDSGMTFLLYGSGGTQLYRSWLSSEKPQQNVTDWTAISGFQSGETHIKIKLEGNQYQLYANNNLVVSYTDTEADFEAGYISFSSGKQNFSIDNLRITEK